MILETSQLPVGALAILNLRSRFLLVGEGGVLKIFSDISKEAIVTTRIFRADAIHGIICSNDKDAVKQSTVAIVAIWAGNALVILAISQPLTQDTRCDVRHVIEEYATDDRILDLSFHSGVSGEDMGFAHRLVVITAQNQVLKYTTVHREPHGQSTLQLCGSVSGPRSTLYSAHILAADSRFILAAGTVTGDIIVWSTTASHGHETAGDMTLHQTFSGHEGSVFGVRLQKTRPTGSLMLASCSDDRSIRLWDISATSQAHMPTSQPRGCLGKARGHISRIWSIRFLPQPDDLPRLLSFGEDGTTQLWQVEPQRPHDLTSQEDERSDALQISHQRTFEFHSGKHIWGVALEAQSDGKWTIVTGGGDGRIASYSLNPSDPNGSLTSLTKMDNVTTPIQSSQFVDRVNAAQSRSLSKTILLGMIGEWHLSRRIHSVFSTQPSGNFEGQAVIERRDTSNDSYDMECIYSEDGNFTSDTGLTFRARRQYVYRYEGDKDELTAWFVKVDGTSVDYLFHTLHVESNVSKHLANQGRSCAINADGHHLCEKDTYDPKYKFEILDGILRSWSLIYTVRGPAKDYTSSATFVRKANEAQPEGETNIGQSMESPQCKPIASTLGSFKAYAWLSERTFLTTTDTGIVLVGTLRPQACEIHSTASLDLQQKGAAAYDIHWEYIDHVADLASTSMLSSIPHLGLAVLSGKSGNLYVFRDGVSKITKLLDGSRKIGFLHIQDFSDAQNDIPGGIELGFTISLRRLGSSNTEIYQATRSSTSEDIAVTRLDYHGSSRKEVTEFVTTSSHYFNDLSLHVEGSRNGELRLSHLSEGLKKIYSGVHLKDAITTVIALPPKGSIDGTTMILTTGRDGRLLTHVVKTTEMEDGFSLETIHASTPCTGSNIEGAYLRSQKNELIVWGFTNTNFIVWNETTRQQLMSVPCGGAHRNWAFLPHMDGAGGSFTCNKAAACLTHYQKDPSHQVIQPGGHGREMKCVAVLPPIECPSKDDGFALIATGAEDTTIRLHRLRNGEIETLAVLEGHNTGIQSLHWSRDGRFLFSSAGTEELYAWRVRRIKGRIYAIHHARCPKVTEDGALRIMDLAFVQSPAEKAISDAQSRFILQAVYSDSSVRSWHYDERKATFTLQSAASYKICVLTQVVHLASRILCTTSSDGHLEWWRSEENSNPQLDLLHGKALHQSSIHSLLSIRHSDKLYAVDDLTPVEDVTLLTGGDDQAIGITRISISPSHTAPEGISSLLIPLAHASAVTSIALAGSSADTKRNRFVSVGTDQRLKTWALEIDPTIPGVEGVHVMKVDDSPTAVADASSLAAWCDEVGVWRVVVVGVGMECRRLGGFD